MSIKDNQLKKQVCLSMNKLIHDKIKIKAKLSNTSVSAYIENLIIQDIFQGDNNVV